MIFKFFNKLIKYYIDKFVDWMRMVKFDFELENQIKKYHNIHINEIAKEKPKIKEVGKFGDDDWSITIGDINKDE